MTIRPFKVQVPQATLDDLQGRLTRTRWTDEVQDADWDYGTNLGYMKELVEYWRTGFDWRAQEEYLNSFTHFRADIDGFGIHFIHERGKGPHPIPLILSHGWPNSFCEMLKIIPLLTDPASHGGSAEDAFDVVVPSLPGYGFSDRPTERGMNSARMADLLARLMTNELGYARFAAQGGDIGGRITELLADSYPDRLLGIHLNGMPFQYLFRRADNLSLEEQKYLGEVGPWQMTEGAYAMIQSTKPQTLGYGLNDSPAGLAAWIVEKFRRWSDCDGDVEKRFTKDELLTNIMIYWTTETINSANRFYYELAHDLAAPEQMGKSEVKTAVAIFPKDILPSPRAWAERWLNLQQWTAMPRGGHFAADEEPELLAEDIRAFFRPVNGSSRTFET